ncbi:hypothetical protein BpHYR1_016299 [Brachionus plicatilis]|uniref:Uncharacterized protein n=1 Tax=Brachionus plicatilis TaxID=10195 RepID=A0A3M7QLE7_BRAPC|nr:hypothetical protein BpHYR1_016299 [Brachionus plicatilis]
MGVHVTPKKCLYFSTRGLIHKYFLPLASFLNSSPIKLKKVKPFSIFSKKKRMFFLLLTINIFSCRLKINSEWPKFIKLKKWYT